MLKKNGKKVITFLIVCSMFGLLQLGLPVFAEEENAEISYSFYVEEFDVRSTEQGDEIIADGWGRIFETGKPLLPSKIFSIAVPPLASIQSVEFIGSDPIVLADTYSIIPCYPSQPLDGSMDMTFDQSLFDLNYDQTYSSNEPYPSDIGEYVRQSHYRKYDMVDVRINPFTYYPLSGILEYYETITVVIQYIPSDNSEKGIEDTLENTEEIAEKLICNYAEAKQWYPQTKGNDREQYDYVVITLDSLSSSITSLVDWEEEKGRNVKVVTTSFIDSFYEGYDLQEKMRNFLREKYPSSEWGIEDLILIGHYDDVPMRRCAQDLGYGKPETDYYYAELSLPDNESWDSNGNHQYGENGDTVDFYTEINVGRLPSSNPSMVESMCSKTVAYEQNYADSFKKNILLLGAFFWDNTDNAVLMEQIVGQSWMSDWTMTRMYEQPQSQFLSDYNLNINNVESVWSQETYGFVNWAGHGSATACYELYPSTAFVNTGTCDLLNDVYPAIIFADACSNHETDHYNIGQAMLEQGAIGFLGSTKVALGQPGWSHPGDGSSQSFDYFFTTTVTSGSSAGYAHQFALAEMYTNGYWSYNAYETFEWGAYLGNPDLYMFSPDPVPTTLKYGPSTYNFGMMNIGETDSTTFDIWNIGNGTLSYSLSETCDWLEVSPISGESYGEHDEITLTVDTTGLSSGSYYCYVQITSNGGNGFFMVNLYVSDGSEILDVDQTEFDRGFPIRHAADGDWACAQGFLPTVQTFTKAELFLRKFGNPEFDLVVELRQDGPEGPLLDSQVFTPAEIPTIWSWFAVDFSDTTIASSTDYFIVCPPAPSGVTTSFGYEWGYAFGDQYGDGDFWFTRDGGVLWRDLPSAYELTFKTFGI